MRVRRRISHLMFLIILCILIFYAGIYMQIDVSGEEMSFRVNQSLIECAGKMYLAGLFYEEDPSNLSGQDSRRAGIGREIAEYAMNLIPIGNYVNSFETKELQIEDNETYEMILALQENDEEVIEMPEESESKTEIVNKIDVEKLKDFEYLVSNFYTVDSSTSVTENFLDIQKLLKKDMTIDTEEDGPKILIYHTHSQEAFKDSRKGKSADTIMGMGAYLASILNEEYGIETIHHEGVYDLIDKKLDRSKAYQLALPEVEKILKENPSIEVVIDLHRDGVKESTHLVTEIDGKKTAQIMFFNGLSRTRANGDIAYLANPYIEDNLAFSLRMQLEAMNKYPGFTRRIYLKSYRYNMHLMPRTLLVEAGAQTNTVEEMRRAMEVLAELLDNVLTTQKKFA